MIITTQVTSWYFDRSKHLFDSIKKYWPGRFVIGCIGFELSSSEDLDYEWFTVDRKDIPSYRADWPKNRNSYVSMQAGDFAKYIDCDDDEIIIQIDADSILQRKFSSREIVEICDLLIENNLLSVYHRNPPLRLAESAENIGCKESDSINSMYNWKRSKEFTCSFMVAMKSFWVYISNIYNLNFGNITKLTDHHAGTQWLFNLLSLNFKVGILPPTYQCASWYEGFDTKVKDGLLYYGKELCLFNHTKFNKQ